MAKHTVFELKTMPLHLNGRELRMSKAYLGQKFTVQTVLTDDVFTYVRFFFSSHRKAMKMTDPENVSKYGKADQYRYDFFWKQAETFYAAAKQLPLEAAPVAAYYCMLNAAKSYLAYTADTADVFVKEFGMHGLMEDHDNLGTDIATISIKHKEHGVFPLFAKSLDSNFFEKWPANEPKTLKCLLSNLPFVHRAFSMTYTTDSKKFEELFLPLKAGDMPKYYKANDGKAYLVIDLEQSYFAPNARTIPTTVFSAIGDDFQIYHNPDRAEEFSFRLVSSLGAQYHQGSISGELKALNDNMRKHFSYIRGVRRLWYLKKVNADTSDILNIPEMILNMAAMHRLSEIARYKPEQLNRLMTSRENWLLHEYITLSLDQFIDELACQITHGDIMCVGQKE